MDFAKEFVLDGSVTMVWGFAAADEDDNRQRDPFPRHPRKPPDHR